MRDTINILTLLIMGRKARSYTDDFKQKAVELTYARGSIMEICRELDIPRSVLGRWRKEMGEPGPDGLPDRGKAKLTDGQKEIRRLEKRLRDAELERDILKKAIGIFSASDRKYTGS